ncbi:hypothetical protein PUNSTDRAFT_141093 [Punctularia strigosozonata HHB-11173 SS5]|uniref:uncharacterized protein n=1 Tax=Punctularia strigosozonata (strain HHB-11173) TaxID=741275 RepID=UPI00044174A4|nr:uncharacterized protein PUNSTDRAFT_141093 [Punctularia strigosozonata HHB-11173 SS5]EIN12368.1 hypothetical protein PUNSTDRAFT_141093 [Punctularia strigosozonata HHB-11173 SS5]
MSANNAAAVATHSPRSLPSFAQTFNKGSLSDISGTDNALPPIQTISPSMDKHQRPRSPPRSDVDESRAARKRPRHEDGAPAPDITPVKEEQDELMDEPLSPPRPLGVSHSVSYQESAGAPSPSTTNAPQSKRRRVTISSMAHPINTNVRQGSVDAAGSNPISPVVMGLQMPRDDPTALEQVRSMLTVKQKQKALIEQRRESTAGLTPVQPSGPSLAGGAPQDERYKSTSGGRAGGRTPPSGPPLASRPRGGSMAVGPGATHSRPGASSIRHPSPPPISSSSQTSHAAATHVSVPGGALPNSLPPPPGSFTRRRAGQLGIGGKKKPADILISPRDAHASGDLAPLIQSAPPVPQAGSGFPGRFPMALPSLPSAMGTGPSLRRVTASRVPPTPTSLTTRGAAAAAAARSPPSTRSVPISNTLVPPTPTTLRHPGYAGEKAAFLAPFEMFYDALADSKELKTWLSDQLQKSNALIQNLQQQQERLDDLVASSVERRLAPIKEECYSLHRRVADLEDELRRYRTPGGLGDTSYGTHSMSSKHPNGAGGMTQDGYTFPPVDRHAMRPSLTRRISSPPRDMPRSYGTRSTVEYDTSSPVPFEASRRHSVSTARFEPPRLPPPPGSSRSEHPMTLEGPGQPASGSVHAMSPYAQRPSLSRHNSTQRTSEYRRPGAHPSRDRESSYRHRASRSPSPARVRSPSPSEEGRSPSTSRPRSRSPMDNR